LQGQSGTLGAKFNENGLDASECGVEIPILPTWSSSPASALGKSHLMTALGYAACLRGHSVLFTGAIDIINTLAAANATGGLKRALAAYVKPELLCIDELGYLPIDKFGADCLFQIISHRYERGATLLTTNRIYKQWAGIFNNDATLTSALLDRLLHHVETVLIEGKSYRAQAHTEL